jgi:hypothetical protein
MWKQKYWNHLWITICTLLWKWKGPLYYDDFLCILLEISVMIVVSSVLVWLCWCNPKSMDTIKIELAPDLFIGNELITFPMVLWVASSGRNANCVLGFRRVWSVSIVRGRHCSRSSSIKGGRAPSHVRLCIVRVIKIRSRQQTKTWRVLGRFVSYHAIGNSAFSKVRSARSNTHASEICRSSVLAKNFEIRDEIDELEQFIGKLNMN